MSDVHVHVCVCAPVPKQIAQTSKEEKAPSSHPSAEETQGSAGTANGSGKSVFHHSDFCLLMWADTHTHIYIYIHIDVHGLVEVCVSERECV